MCLPYAKKSAFTVRPDRKSKGGHGVKKHNEDWKKATRLQHYRK